MACPKNKQRKHFAITSADLSLSLSLSLSVSPFLVAIFQVDSIRAKDNGGGGELEYMCKAPDKSSPNQHPVFTGWMPFLFVANQQCQSTEGKIIC